MAAQAKDTIYIDIDDEITVIIDKLKNAQSKIVALVLPKRATVFQSSVNMKLLKKTADTTKKRLVLITSEANLLPLAGSIGIYVAKNLQSKPAIPDFTNVSDADKAIDTLEMPAEGDKGDFDKEAAAGLAVGELAEPTEEVKKAKPELTPMPIPLAGEPDDTIDMDKAEPEAKEEATKDEKDKKDKPAKDKSLKVPNFNKFRIRLIIAAIVLILLIIGWVLLNGVLAKAKITITSQTTSVNASLSLTLDSTASSPNQSSLTLPAHLQQISKTVSQSVTTTGQQNNGAAATGTVTITECISGFSFPQTIPAGTGVIANNLTFITQAATSFPKSGTPDPGNGCYQYQATAPTNITAQNGGSNYNLASNNFTVNGYPNASGSGSTSGGTDDIVQTVTQNDINNATAKLTAPNTATVTTALESALTQAGYYPIASTLTTGTPTTTDSANVGAQASSVTVSQATSYTMFGVHESQLQSMLNNYINSQINTSKQSIISNGFSQASYTMTTSSTTAVQVALQDTAEVGLHLNVTSLKSQVAGKKTGQVVSLVSNDPGVTNVKVSLSPFWVSSVPSNTSKITVILQSATHAKST